MKPQQNRLKFCNTDYDVDFDFSSVLMHSSVDFKGASKTA